MNPRLLIALLALLIAGCSATEGEGGRTTLTGQAYYRLEDQQGNFLGREEARNEDVYIIYGENELYDDDINTHSNGQYQFQHLFKGNYTVFGYSDCPGCDSGVEETGIKVELSGKNETFVAPDLELTRVLAPDDGTGNISGRVRVKEYNTTGELVAEYYGADQDVFILYGDATTPFERVITSGEGYFNFPNLIPGTYVVYSFSECDNCPGGITPSEIEVEVPVRGASADAGNIIVEQR